MIAAFWSQSSKVVPSSSSIIITHWACISSVMNGLNLDQFYNLSIRLNNSILNSSGGILGLECQNGGCPNNLTNSSAEFSENPEKVYSALLLILLPILAVLGNILVILSVYKEKSLQSVTNYFIVSLGLADLLVACFVMPFAVYYLVSCPFLLLYHAASTVSSEPN